MRVTCPACNAEASLEALLSREADARAVATFLERHLALGDLLLRYVGLFRPAKRRLGIARMVALLEELLPDIERAAINRKGKDWPAPRDTWRAGIETVLAKRDKGTLTLPLTSHGLLYEVMCGIAEKYEAQAESQAEAERKNRRGGGAAAPRDLAVMASDIGTAPGSVAAPVPYAPYTGPSKAAQALKAQMQAALAARQGMPSEEPPTTGAAT